MGSQDNNLSVAIEWGVAGRPIPGESESGDNYVVKPLKNGAIVAVVDGLGHGPEAAASAKVAVNTLEANADESVISLVNRCHERLRGMRGAVITLASINSQAGTMTWLGVGNVEGMLLRSSGSPSREYIVQRGGVVGAQLPILRPSITTIKPGDTLIMATDGISHGFAERVNPSESPQKIADRILITYNKLTDDALVLVVRYTGPSQ